MANRATPVGQVKADSVAGVESLALAAIQVYLASVAIAGSADIVVGQVLVDSVVIVE